jgi:hypothetical protein
MNGEIENDVPNELDPITAIVLLTRYDSQVIDNHYPHMKFGIEDAVKNLGIDPLIVKSEIVAVNHKIIDYYFHPPLYLVLIYHQIRSGIGDFIDELDGPKTEIPPEKYNDFELRGFFER